MNVIHASKLIERLVLLAFCCSPLLHLFACSSEQDRDDKRSSGNVGAVEGEEFGPESDPVLAEASSADTRPTRNSVILIESKGATVIKSDAPVVHDTEAVIKSDGTAVPDVVADKQQKLITVSAEKPVLGLIAPGTKYADGCVAGDAGDLVSIVSIDDANGTATGNVFCNSKRALVPVSASSVKLLQSDPAMMKEYVSTTVDRAAETVAAAQVDNAAIAQAAEKGSCQIRVAKILQNQITPVHNNCRKPQEPTTDAKRTELTNRIETLAKTLYAIEVTNWQNAQMALAQLREMQAALQRANVGESWISKQIPDYSPGWIEDHFRKSGLPSGSFEALSASIQSQISYYSSVPVPDFNRTHSVATRKVMDPICSLAQQYFNRGGRAFGQELAYVVESLGAQQLDVKFAPADYPVFRQKTGPNDFQGWGGLFKTTDVTLQDGDVTELPFRSLLPSTAQQKGLMTVFMRPLDSKGVQIGDTCTFMQGLYNPYY